MRIALTLDRDACARDSNDYVRALCEAGFARHEIIVVSPGEAPPENVDGIVLGGGGDVDPRRYGEDARRDARLEVDPERDATDFALFDTALQSRTPTLAICRGLQVANVALGGTLVQDLPDGNGSGVTHDGPDEEKSRLQHPVRIFDGTRLSAIVGSGEIEVNSRHHQAIARPAPGLVVSAVAPDGTVEAVESREPWLLAVQWHPENLADEPCARRLFEEFARCVRERALSGAERSRGERTG